jgi:tetratricopeptide (TPR) repeat protein
VLVALAIAAQLSIVAHAPDSAYACEAIDVSVAVGNAGTGTPQLTAPTFRPFDVLRSTMRVENRSGRQRSFFMREYRYTITTDRVGSFTIPPFEAMLGGERVRSQPVVISLRPMRARALPSVVARARIDTSAGMNLGSSTSADTVYVGQQATYEVAVFLNQTVRDRLRRNPTFYPPEMQAMLAYDLPAPSRATRERVGSQCFDALVYRRALFPLVPGRLVIPPAQLVYSTGLSSSSLFSREESHELQTDSVTIVAIDPPQSGRPAEYAGAVGEMRLAATIDSGAMRVGDPMLVTLKVSGTGNVKLFPRPTVRVPWAGLVAADERVSVDSTSSRIGGTKEFDWVLTPRVAGEFDVPPVRYGYFDPSSRRYEVAVSSGTRLRVAPGALANSDTGQVESALPIRIGYGGPAWPPLQSQPVFWLAMLLAPLPALVTAVRRRGTTPLSKGKPAPDPMRALITAAARDAVALRRQFVKALAQRLGCNPEDFTHPGALDRALRRAGVSEDTATRAEALLRVLDSAAYASTGGLPQNAAREASGVAVAVDTEALRRSELPLWIPALVAAVVLAGAAYAASNDPAAPHFARGVSAYIRHDYPAAQVAFETAVELAPTAGDAWANYGTAAWSATDTASAVFAWRQGLSLDPNASDLQQYINLPREVGMTSPGWVPGLPRNAAVWLFGLLWISAWVIAWGARRQWSWRHAPAVADWTGRLALPLGACALIVGLMAIEIESRTAGNQLAVIQRAGQLTSDPALGMDRGPAVGTGEIVRIVGRRGVWSRVEATEDRDGWIASSQLLPLSDRRPPRTPLSTP